MYWFCLDFQWIFIDFSMIFEKNENLRFLHWLQNKISQRLMVQITSEEVRLIALDSYFMETTKFLILPHFLKIPGTIEEGSKISSSFLNPSSNAVEIKGDWGRVGNFKKFGKFECWRFERTSSEVFWTNSRWEIPIWMCGTRWAPDWPAVS